MQLVSWKKQMPTINIAEERKANEYDVATGVNYGVDFNFRVGLSLCNPKHAIQELEPLKNTASFWR